MFAECIVCKKVVKEVGDKKNGSITGTICDSCLIAIEEYRFYRRMYKKTGFKLFKDLMDNVFGQLAEKERR